MKRQIFFFGTIILIVGLLVGIYDYPQLIYLENKSNDLQLDVQELEKFKRIQIEFFIGVGMIILGAGSMIFGILPKKSLGIFWQINCKYCRV